MTDAKRTVTVMDPVKLASRARNAENRTSRAYIACLSGMWAHTLGLTKDPITPSDNEDIRAWYETGVKASAQAVNMGAALAAKEKEKEKKKGIKSFFHLK